jgi:enoyl-CoA hydratase/carnithine racemase
VTDTANTADTTEADAEPPVLREDRGNVATLTMNRPANRNALSAEMIAALHEALRTAGSDPRVHVVVLAGSGPAFSAGHDLREIQHNPDPAYREGLFTACSRLMVQITKLQVPVIAKVAGVATAAGCQLAATCDLVVAAESARFATPGVDIGLFCTTPMVALTRAVAPKHAMEMLLTGDLIGAAEAYRIGLVNRVVPTRELDDAVSELAARIAAKPPQVVAIGKAAYWSQRDLPLADAYTYASGVMVENLGGQDAAEGIDAFLSKRRPIWNGR